jgi:hypothetical protein
VKLVLSGLFAAAVAVVAAPAGAGVFYRSIPDLTVTPNVLDYCSPCAGGFPQSIGEVFSLGASETVRSVTFAIDSTPRLSGPIWPVPVTLSFFDFAPGAVGAPVVSEMFSSYASDVPVSAAGTDVVTVNLTGGGLALSAGSYELFITNPLGSLYVPAYQNLSNGNGISVGGTLAENAAYQLIGNHYDMGVALSNSPVVPESSTWAMMTIGFAGLGVAALRRGRRPSAAIA